LKPVAIHKYYEDIWTDGWISHCVENSIPHEVINGYEDGIIAKLGDFSALFWNFNPWRYEDLLFARHILKAAEFMGLKIYPNDNTAWTYDDKIAQKYLFEAVGVPMAPTHVFYDLEKALAWAEKAPLPVIGKLRRGAASNNVFLLKTKKEVVAHCRRMFGKGFNPAPRLFDDMGVRMNKARKLKSGKDLVRAVAKLAKKISSARKFSQVERGYALFQEFMPANSHDVRIFVIGDKAWGFTRNMRKGDFRASGSGSFDYSRERMPVETVKAAFECSRKVGAQAMNYDFLRDGNGVYRIIEMSCGTFAKPTYDCPGHWDRDLNWHEGHSWPQQEIYKVVVEGGN
jgi:glutathione synthase/RimK-type ligase-like ATP-grasp enzyme